MKKIYFVFLTLLLVGICSINTYSQVETFVRQTTIAVPAIEPTGFGNVISGVDLDGDGKMEIYAVNNNWNDAGAELIPRIYKFEFDGTKWDTVWRATLNIPLQNTWPALAIGDLDKDGKMEVIWAPINFTDATKNPNPARVVVFEVKGDGSDILGIPDGTGNYLPNAQWNMGVANMYNLRPFRWFVADVD
ncbi:MAG: VCBS repeat-containing protein, partial [Bacteroidetes bacterium]|nr:VCBS repeat-containing protein [Bacteroidota bacterium]